jgi:hypothetical protein
MLGERDRFLLTLGDPRVVAHWVDSLFVGHTARERGLHAAAALLPARLQGRLLLRPVPRESAPAAELLLTTLERDRGALLRQAGLDGRRPFTWIFLADYAANDRGGGVAFLFDGGPRPRVVLKLRRPGVGVPCLAREWEALHAVRGRLSPDLQPTIPAPLAFSADAGIEALATSWLPGRSAYVELQTALLPARRLAGHFAAAAEWLAAFQRATRAPGGPTPAEEGESLLAAGPGAWEGNAGRRAAWLDRLRGLERIASLARGAAHGDFWARNLLAGGAGAHGVGVVDWEGYAPDAPPWRDLFHFPLSHALAYPWGPRYRRPPPAAALARAFLGDAALARQVRGYFVRWSTAAAVPPAVLAPLLHLELLDRSRRQAAGGSAEGDPWIELHHRLARADRSVFSG